MDAMTRLRPECLVRSPAFSHVAIVPPGATTIDVGGQNGVDPSGAVVSGDAGEQAARAIDNAATALGVPGAVVEVSAVAAVVQPARWSLDAAIASRYH